MQKNVVKLLEKKKKKANLRASYGCLGNFKKRHQIVFNGTCDESSNVCEETVTDQFAELQPV